MRRHEFGTKCCQNVVKTPFLPKNPVGGAAIKEDRAKSNDDLFAFIVKEEIDYVFCFSRLVYNNLPKLYRENDDDESCILADRTHYLMKCVYYPGERDDMKQRIKKPLVVYGLKYPSRGYSPQKFREAVADILHK